MSPQITVVTAREVIKVALKVGFEFDRQKGSHAVEHVTAGLQVCFFAFGALGAMAEVAPELAAGPLGIAVLLAALAGAVRHFVAARRHPILAAAQVIIFGGVPYILVRLVIWLFSTLIA